MAKNDMVRYIVPVTFPDGVRIIGGFTPGDRAESVKHIQQIVASNPDAQFDIDDIRWNVTEEDVQKAIADWREANPGRAAASELGLDVPNRILTDPEISRNLAAQQTPAETVVEEAPKPKRR